MGKRKGRRALAEADPVDVQTSDACCDKSDGGETAASCSSGEEGATKETPNGGSLCCSKETEDATGEQVDGCCASEAVEASDCCSSKAREDGKEVGGCCFSKEKGGKCSSKGKEIQEEVDDCSAVKEGPKKTGCCSSKEEKVPSGAGCCSSTPTVVVTEPDDCCASKTQQTPSGCGLSKSSKAKPADSGCCSSKTLAASDCCSSKVSNGNVETKVDMCFDEPKKADCCYSKAPSAQPSGCCSSRDKGKASGSGCSSSKAMDLSLPERSPSFMKRLVQFRNDRGATLEQQRSSQTRSGCKGKSAEGLEILRLNISGMTCSGCCTRIEKFMSGQRGVVDVNVSLLTSRGIFQFDPLLVTAKYIEETVSILGFEPSVLSSDDLVGIVLHLGQSENVPCAKKLVLEVAGVASAECFSETTSSSGSPSKALLIEYNPSITGARKIVRQLSQELGFTIQASTPRAPSVRAGEEEVRRFTRLLLWSCLLSLPVIFVEFVVPALFSSSSDVNPADAAVWGTAGLLSVKDAVEFVCATPVLFLVAFPIHESAFLALRYGGRVTMDVLISLSACTAYAFSVFTVVTEAIAKFQASKNLKVDPLVQGPSLAPQEQVGTPMKTDTFFQVTVLLVTLILLGRYIETLVKARASNSVDALLRMQAKTAILLEDEGQKELYIDVVLVEHGDILKVLPGTRVPTDGVVVGGASSVDESMVTGEARKVPKEPGATVIGGSINSQGVLTMRVTHTIHESMLARMVRLVGEAQASRGVRQSVADAVAAYFTTFIIILAVCMFMLWYSLAKHGRADTQGWAPFPFALRFAITVLVISCPCAISLAVPTAVMVATTKGSQVGVLFKGGRALEALEEVDAVVFDKTGTLTTARLGVAGVFYTPREGFDGNQLWRFVASAESGSEHSIGKTLVSHAQTRLQGTQVDEAQEFEAVPGCGVRSIVNGADIRIGSLTWLKQQRYGDSGYLKVHSEFTEANQRFQSQGCIVVFLVVNGELLSAIALRDTARPEAKCVIEQLKREGIQPWIVTGDQRGTAMSVAAALGVSEGSVLAESLPHQKVDKVRLLQSLGLRVAFVGDGVNDAPALATADVGVALGAGTDVAIDAADVVLVKDDLRDLLNARALSCATNRRIKHNFAWGFMYNLLMMPVACGALYGPLGIWIPPALAGLSELLSSVPVILFSLLLNLWIPPFRGDWGLQQDHVAIDVTETTPLLRN